MNEVRSDINVLAVTSLVLGILGFVALPVVGAAGAIVTGEIAKRQILRSGDAGLACARWGTILGALWFVLALTLFVLLSSSATHGPTWILAAGVAVAVLVALVMRRRA